MPGESTVEPSVTPTLPRFRVVSIGPSARHRGGVEVFFRRFNKALASEVEVVPLPLRLPGLLDRSRAAPAPAAEEGDALSLFNPRAWVRGARFVARQQAGVVLLTQWMPATLPAYLALALLLRLLCRGQRPTLLLLLHDAYPDRRWPFARLLLRLLLRAVDGATVLTPEVGRSVHALRPTLPLSLCPHPVYDVYPPLPPQAEARTALGLADKRTLLFFGHVKPYKGLDLLLDAFPAVQRQTDVQLVVAGPFHPSATPLRARMAALNSGLETPAVVLMPDFVPDEQVPLFFAAADVVVLPYRRPAASGVLEIARHYGKPAVLPHFEAFEAAIDPGETGVLFAPGDADALAAAIGKALRLNPARVAAASAQRARAGSWDAFARVWLDFARQVSAELIR